MNINFSVLSTVAALGADCTIVNKSIMVTGLTPIPYSSLKPTSIIAPVTEVVQISTGTVTPANSTYYAIALTYRNKVTKQTESKIFSFLSDSSTTDQEVATALRNSINAVNATVPIVATGTTTLILTAEAGFAQFSVTNIGVGVITFAATQAGVVRVGYGADLLQVFPDATGSLVTTSYYYQCIMDYGSGSYGTQTMTNSNVVNRSAVFVLSGATNIDTLVGTYGTLTQAIAGKNTTWTAASANASVTNGVITIVTDVFYGNTDTNIGPFLSGDVVMIGSVGYVVDAVITGATANTATTPNDASAATTFYVKLRSII